MANYENNNQNNDDLFDFLVDNESKGNNIQLSPSEVQFVQNARDNNISNETIVNQSNLNAINDGRVPLVNPSIPNGNPIQNPQPGLIQSLNQRPAPNVQPINTGTEDFAQAKKIASDSTEAIQKKLGTLTPRFANSKKQDQPKPIKDITPTDMKGHNIEAIKMMSDIQPKNSDLFDENLKSALPGTAKSQSDEIDDTYVAIANREIVCPVDLDISAGTNNVTPYFSLKNTLASWGFPGLGKLLDIDIEAFRTAPFFKNLAQKQYAEYKRKLQMTFEERQKLARKSVLRKILIVVGIIAVLAGLIIPKIKSSKSLSDGHQAIAQGKYELAEEIMCNEAKDDYYCVYAQGLNACSKKDYEKAYLAMDKLEPYQANLKYNIEETRNEIKYQQANYLLESKNYADGLELLKEISNYKDSAEIFYGTCYQLAKSYEDSPQGGEISIKYYYMAKDYQDARQKFEEASQNVYDSALNFYNSRNYDEAQKHFSFLAQYQFKDASTMTKQCIYRRALNALLAGNFEESNELFSQIKDFKDSSSLIVNIGEIPEFEVQYVKCTEGTSFDEASEDDIDAYFGTVACRFGEEFFQGKIVIREVVESDTGTSETVKETTYASLAALNQALQDLAIENDATVKYEFRMPDDPIFAELATLDGTDETENPEEINPDEKPEETPATEEQPTAEPEGQEVTEESVVDVSSGDSSETESTEG